MPIHFLFTNKKEFEKNNFISQPDICQICWAEYYFINSIAVTVDVLLDLKQNKGIRYQIFDSSCGRIAEKNVCIYTPRQFLYNLRTNHQLLTSSKSSSGVAGVLSVLSVLYEVTDDVSESTDSSSNPKNVSTTCL